LGLHPDPTGIRLYNLAMSREEKEEEYYSELDGKEREKRG